MINTPSGTFSSNDNIKGLVKRNFMHIKYGGWFKKSMYDVWTNGVEVTMKSPI